MNNRIIPQILKTPHGRYAIYSLSKISGMGISVSVRLPFSIRLLLENALRHFEQKTVSAQTIQAIAAWQAHDLKPCQVLFHPARVILQDFTGVPCVVDLAAMRSAMKRLNCDFRKINPQVPCDLVIDHSLQVDFSGSKNAFEKNLLKEFSRNSERYKFLKWSQHVFRNFRVVPPATGIIHQVNLEYLASGVLRSGGRVPLIYPDSCIGTDSHTTMVNCLGILGWGVGGIEAEAVMLGEPLAMLLPEVVGVKLNGELPPGVTASDLVLSVTQRLRSHGVVGKCVEFFGPGMKRLSLTDRATISNMAPEYGATVGFFPVDEETLKYYSLTGRKKTQVDLIERYMKEQGLFYAKAYPDPEYTDVLEIDLSQIELCVAGPKRPQDRIGLQKVRETFKTCLEMPVKERGYGLSPDEISKSMDMKKGARLTHGSVVLASITSCTNTSNPELLIGAGLLARNAIRQGLRVKPYVKTSLAPGSQVAGDYLKTSGLMKHLEKLGFYNVGYGCATCIGNSGPLAEDVSQAIQSGQLVAASVLSGNRNFEGRIHPLTRANFLASPLLVVAYALAGTVSFDFETQALGMSPIGKKIFLKDIWPDQNEIERMVKAHVTSLSFRKRYKNVFRGDRRWNAIKAPQGEIFSWNPKSTYIQEPPYFCGFKPYPEEIKDILSARVLVLLGDSITTDHISPAGNIPVNSVAGEYLMGLGVDPQNFNSYGSRRGNDRVMTRGTFANIRLRNLLVPESEGEWTRYFPGNEKMRIYDAAQKYAQQGVPLMILAGKEYGTGSSRDWAAKGTALLGVKVVLARSFERIHRGNLVGMGVLPLCFKPGESAETLGIQGDEIFDITGMTRGLTPRMEIPVKAKTAQGKDISFTVNCAIDTEMEIEYYKHGGILPKILRQMIETDLTPGAEKHKRVSAKTN